MQVDLKRIIENVGKEKNIDKELLVTALREALLTAARKDKDYSDSDLEAIYNEDSEEVELFRYRVVVGDDDVKNIKKEIPVSEAQKLDESLQVGDEVGENLSTKRLGRIAAQAARQIIVQKVQEAEKDKIFQEFREKKGQLVTGQVRRFDKQDIIVDLGACDAVLPSREQIPQERFKIRDQLSALLMDVRKTARGPQVILSRAHPEVLIRLFEQEVTEVLEGTVEILSAARDPGSRSKIAVHSHEPTVDPVGACVGMKGARVQSIVQELKGEKIDIIPFDRDPARFVCNALAPAQVSKVIINENARTMEVVVPDDNLSLAIGRRGQNVRLAAQLTGWKVDIRSESKMKDLVKEYKDVLARIPNLGEMRSEILVNEGYQSPTDLANVDPRQLMKMLRLEEEEAEAIIAAAKDLADQLEKEKDEIDDEELEAIQSLAELDGVVPESFEGEDDLGSIEDIVAQTKVEPLQDPEKVDVSACPEERQRYWMQLRGVGPVAAAVLEVAPFKDLQAIAHSNAKEIAHQTGLPHKLSGKIHAEASKIVGEESGAEETAP